MSNTALPDRILHVISSSDAADDDLASLPSDMEDMDVEEVNDISEQELLRYLDADRPPLDVVRGLFKLDPTLTDVPSMRLLPRENLLELSERGWTVLDDIVPAEVIKGARGEAERLWETGAFTKASNINKMNGDDPFRDGEARGDYLIWLHEDKPTSPNLSTILAYFSTLHSDMVRFIKLNNETEFQLAYYPPNGRYETHRDAFPIDDPEDSEQRRVTAIIYLNPEWKAGDGGELRLHSKERVDVEPIGGKVVVFLSGVVDHEVMAAGGERFAVTAWYR